MLLFLYSLMFRANLLIGGKFYLEKNIIKLHGNILY
jgi:hypothetical protein